MPQEYPKVIHAGGLVVTVANATEEARWLGSVPNAPQPAATDAPVPSVAPEAEAEPESKLDGAEEVPATDDTTDEPKARLVKNPAPHKGGKKK